MGVEEAEKMSTSLGPIRMDVYSSWHHGVFGVLAWKLFFWGFGRGPYCIIHQAAAAAALNACGISSQRFSYGTEPRMLHRET